jgi:hypothetical protein
MNERVRIGKTKELEILQQMQDQGFPITEATEREDKISKIDGWWLIKPGQPAAGLQIKYRETGDDILFEAILDIENGKEGRDMRGKADYYLSVDRKGSGAIVRTAELKDRIRRCLTNFNLESDNDQDFEDEGVCLKVRKDPYHGQRKCIAFVKKSSIPIVKQLKFTGFSSPASSSKASTLDRWMGTDE